MEITATRAPAQTRNARNLPQGTVYTWGEHFHHYMRVSGGSVVLKTGDFIPDNGAFAAHFDQTVEVAKSSSLTLEY